MTTCERCGGSGRSKHKVTDTSLGIKKIPIRMIDDISDICPDCNGSGKVKEKK